ncbi:MAG TPA: CCA tRNA nucleotidyltransferase [Victivallales bacterium]|nr:CCA tRNA nucleotidyltransferase [Victivallales bacterium]
MPDNKTLYNTAFKIIQKLQNNGYETFIVGGSVRDKLLGYQVKDIDIVTSAQPHIINELFKKTYNIGAAFGIVNIIENKYSFEVATFRKESDYEDGRHPTKIEYTESPELDAMRRDFTINALYYDPINNKIIDFHNGIDDIKKGILRTIGPAEKRFKEDYLRILRAIRFSLRFDIKIDQEILEVIPNLANSLNKLSKERVRDELCKIFTGPAPDKAFQLLYDTGIMDAILPELSNLKGVTQPKAYHPEGDVFEHTKIMLSKMAMPSLELAWAILLHDIGKPDTLEIGSNGIERFYFHANHGKNIAKKILIKYKLPKKTIDRVSYAVKNHMRFGVVHEMRVSKYIALMAEPTFPLELELHRIDCLSSHMNVENFIFLIDKLIEQKGETKLPPPLITGNDLIKLGLKPGPIFNKLLNNIRVKQIEKSINTKKEAIRTVKELIQHI